ncbi:MAG: DUF1566 domain-containing protein [Candidatus Electrothrix scaldis]|nr:DUF1566 domain-containing protein [Candidatus Electrothrix aestuarii]WPD22251.1 MAG: DUF1566 domain-containing protein [Candidatus Electrothrix sp. GW3-3]
MKKKRPVFSIAVLWCIVVCGLIKVAYSYDLLLMVPPILSGKKIGWQPLNDTGITWSGNYASGNNATCLSSTAPDGDNVAAAQDCSYGKDVNDDGGDGHAGFSFTKLASNGQALANQNADYTTTSWACVKDNVTGLTWEVKTDDSGLHDKDDEYTWYNTDSTNNGGFVGYAQQSGNSCYGYDSGDPATYCNTQDYVNRVNAAGWCGASDWRVPTRTELESIVIYDHYSFTLDTDFFVHAVNSFFWSSSPYAYNINYTWCVSFANGLSSYDNYRSSSYAVRLVRGGQ